MRVLIFERKEKFLPRYLHVDSILFKGIKWSVFGKRSWKILPKRVTMFEVVRVSGGAVVCHARKERFHTHTWTLNSSGFKGQLSVFVEAGRFMQEGRTMFEVIHPSGE